MVGSIIVTVRFQNLQKELDLELPCQIPVSQVQKELMAGLKLNGVAEVSPYQRIRFWNGSKPVSEEKSFAEAGIWDGAILTAKMD